MAPLSLAAHPLALFVASNAIFILTAARTSRASPIRYVALGCLIVCAYLLPQSLQSFAQTTGWAGRVCAGAGLNTCLNFTDKLLIRGWDYEHYGSSATETAVSAGGQKGSRPLPAGKSPRSRDQFVSEVTGNVRGIGTFWQVRNVPPFSLVQPAFVPSRVAFLFKQTFAVIACYNLHNLAVRILFSLDFRYFETTHVPLFATLGAATTTNLYSRIISTASYWTIQYAMIQFFYSLAGLLSAFTHPESIELWPPMFGSAVDAYTLRNFWG
ncbi:hypothetical protein LTR65_007414 [Meristemomyces frigidus]